MAQEWFYTKNGNKIGPIPPSQLQALAKSGELTPNDMIWKEGMAQWAKASSIKGLFPASPVTATPPIPPASPPPTPQPPMIPEATLAGGGDSSPNKLKAKWNSLTPVWKLAAGGGVLMFLLSFCCCGVGIVSLGRNDSDGKQAGGKGIETTSGNLIDSYKGNEVSADQMYKGKTLDVSGRIHSIGKDIMNNPYVTLDSGRQFELVSVQCFFDRRHEGELAKLQKGQFVTIRGKCGGKMMNVLLKNATLVGQ